MSFTYVTANACWIEGRAPKYKVGSKVWVIDRLRIGECNETEIRSYAINGHEFNGKFVLIFKGYNFSNIGLNMGREDDETTESACPESEVFLTEREAKKKATFVKAKFRESTWKKAIGLGFKTPRRKYNEECELGPCCAIVAEIRDFLAKCMHQGGLIQFDIDHIKHLIDRHSHGGHGHFSGSLGRIFQGLGIEKKTETANPV